MSRNLIYNKLKILVDPRYFADKSKIHEQVNFIDMLQDYLDNTDPALCDVVFYYPTFIEDKLNLRRVFNSLDNKSIRINEPKKVINFFNEKIIPEISARQIQNELLSLAIEHKIPYILSDQEIKRPQEIDLMKRYNISVVKRPELQQKIKAFLQGFYKYYKFDLLYGVDSADIAHAMSDPLHKKLNLFENKVRASSLAEDSKERVRSFVHNRYIDILVTLERILFYKVQQQISDIERGILDNKKPQYHGSVRYYLNYYLLLLWGYLDHLSLIINDLFDFGYDEDTRKGQRKIGFKDTDDKKEYLEKIKIINVDLYNFITSKDFQEWLDVLGQLRHRNAHREMISPSPLLQPTEASKVSDAEIDAILYKDNAPIDNQTYEAFVNILGKEIANSTVETQKAQDRFNYKISKMDKIVDHCAIVKNGFLDPVARISIDMENLNKLTELFLKTAEKVGTLK